MKKKTGLAAAAALVVGMVGFGVAPAHAASCSTGNMCSFTLVNRGGIVYHGGSGDFVEVADDVTDSAENLTSKNYNAKNNTVLGQEEILAYISAGGYVPTFGGNNNKIDHYRKA